jgi:hypothetical protein
MANGKEETMILEPAPISTERFTYSADSKVFVAEASDLGDFRLGRVYDDACDVGMTLVSKRSGARLVFALSREVRNSEGELLFTEFAAVGAPHGGPTVRFGSLYVRVYND